MKKFFAWEKQISEYDPKERLEYNYKKVKISGLEECYISTYKFTQWHPMTQKRVFVVVVPKLEKVLIFNYQDIEFNPDGLVLVYNLKGNITKTFIHFDNVRQIFIIDDIKRIPRHDD